MKVFERYFSKNKVMYFPEFPGNISLMLVVPVFDDPDIFKTIDSLCQCRGEGICAGVIIVVNHSENCPDEVKRRNEHLADEIERYTGRVKSPVVTFQVVRAFDLPVKQAGVGLARKIGMDCAASFFYRSGNPDGVIVSLDADTLVSENYLVEITRFFKAGGVAGVTIAYEHRIGEGGADQRVRGAMDRYEIYLHYYQLALRYCGHPHAFHCIGSAFAVRVSDYVAQGGMNKRQAGEDFYFLQKLIATGRYDDLVTTRVFPSARFSRRTPFGTGQSLLQIIENGDSFPVYCFDAFLVLRSFFASIGELYGAKEQAVIAFRDRQAIPLCSFLVEMGFTAVVAEVNANCASERQFVRRFFDNFNAFRVLKYLNYAHQGYYVKTDIVAAANGLLTALNLPSCNDTGEMLGVLKGMTWGKLGE